MPIMSGAEALVASLINEGVEVVFGMPGWQVMEVMDAFYHHPEIRWITVRHEQAAAYMALGYGRTTGKPGVALVVPGPGALNTATALGTAYATSSPLLLVSGGIETYNLGKNQGALHEVDDQLDALKPITKWQSRAFSPEAVPSLIHEGIRRMRTGRPRPVVVEVPWDVARESGDVSLPKAEPVERQAPDKAAIAETARLLSKAKNPLIWAGGGVISSGASAELTALAERLNAPVLTTMQAKGSIREDHPLAMGVFFYGHGTAHYLVPEADVLLVVGSRLYVTPPQEWAFPHDLKLVQIDTDPEQLGKTHPVHLGINGDAKAALQALLGELPEKSVSTWRQQELQEARGQVRKDVETLAPLQLSILDTLRSELEEDAFVVTGITNVGHWAHLGFPVLHAGTYITSSYFATLGYAFPTALGVKVANPNRQVVTLSGDGGFMFSPQELATAVQENINVVTLVFSDGALGSSLNDQRLRFGGRAIGTQIRNPDFVRLAESFGARGMRAENSQELGQTLREALRADVPVVIDVPMPTLDPSFQVPPRTGTPD